MNAAESGVRIGADTEAVLVATGLIFLWALVLGVIKYRQMATSPDALAHPYTDTAHRAALLYSFAGILVAVFVELSSWSDTVNLIAAGGLFFFFVFAIAGYMWHGLRRDTDNQFRPGEQPPGLHPYMWALITTEIGAFAVLFAGFLDAHIL